jgi:hypothetical protein
VLSNILSLAVDLEATGPADKNLVSLKVVGIEDLIVEQVACWLKHPTGEAATRIRVLTGLARRGSEAGCGPVMCSAGWLGHRAGLGAIRLDERLAQRRRDHRLPFMRVGDDQFHSLQATLCQTPEEAGPKRFGFRRTDVQPGPRARMGNWLSSVVCTSDVLF